MSADATAHWIVIGGIALGTFALRSSFVMLFGRLEEVPPRLERALRFVPPAVLAALVLPSLVLLDGRLALSPDNARLVAGGIGILVAWRTESMFATVVAGMVALWTLTYFG